MHCAFIGCCLLTMVNFSVSLHIFQKPRFLGVKHQDSVRMYCAMQDQNTSVVADWFKTLKYDLEPEKPMDKNDRFMISKKGNVENGLMEIRNLQPEDSAVYYCKLNGKFGPGTELQVFRKINAENAVKRSRIKDTMIFIQALLLVAVVVTPLVLRHKQVKKEEDVIYEEPEEDHTYEGLEIEHCDLYEAIPALCQNSEATWEMVESTCDE